MKNKITIAALGVLFLFSCQTQKPVSQEEDNVVHDGIRWGGENETANYLASRGTNHYVNLELAKALTLWEHAVKLDSSLFAPHTMLSLITIRQEEKQEEIRGPRCTNFQTAPLFIICISEIWTLTLTPMRLSQKQIS